MNIKATFSDFKIVKTRGVAQLVFEVPLEAADAALGILGGVPKAAEEVWVAIAPVATSAANVTDLEAQRCHKLAHALCGDPEFQEWVCTKKGLAVSEDNAAVILRRYCGINHRSPAEFATNVEAQKRLNQLDYMWRVTK